MIRDLTRDNTVRTSSLHEVGTGGENAIKDQADIIQALGEEGYHIRVGTADEEIDLVGDNGVQKHIQQSGAYIFHGKPSLGEAFKLVSLFVGLQTLDPDLQYEKNGKFFRRPVVVYGEKKDYQSLIDLLNALYKEGTIKQAVEGEDGLLRFAGTPDQLKAQLRREVAVLESIHGEGVDPEKIERRAQKYSVGVQEHGELVDPEYKAIAYTSASQSQPKDAAEEARKYGELLVERGIGLISGLGKTGLMGEVHNACVEAGGWSEGANCPHIIVQEGMPRGFSRANIIEDIYARMQVMFAPCDFIGASVGGRGGGGSLQEILGAFLLMELGREEMIGKDGKAKPVVIDNRLGIWDDLVPLMKSFGFSCGKDYHFANGTQEMIEKIDLHREGKLAVGEVGAARDKGLGR